VSTEGWIFMVGFRLFDVGLLVLWLVWFFRLRDDGDDGPDDDGPGGGGSDGPPPGPGGGGGGLRLPAGRFRPGPRLRDHGRGRPRVARRGGRRSQPVPQPARVRRPVTPVPTHRR
jgi:hypothetical protein